MVETDKTNLPPQTLLSDEERAFVEASRTYADIPEPLPEKDNPDALFANGWGRRGHFALLVAPSGVGKSVISTQALVPWTLGKPALFGSDPLIPLRVAVIQAEDDDTEMGEFRRDHRLGHLAEGFTAEEIAEAEKRVWDWSRFFRGKTGDDFIRGLDLALRCQAADVVVMNPLQSYTGFDIADNSQLSAFLRTSIDGILSRFRVFMLCVHHTNKPNTNRQSGPAWGEDSTMAYCGAGGAELTNYARSVTIIRPCTAKESKLERSYVLLGAKRGNRLGWKDADGKRTSRKIIAYSEDYIHWRVPSQDELDAAAVAETDMRDAPEMTPKTPAEAADMIAAIVRADWPKKVWRHCHDKLRKTISTADFKAAWEYFTINHKSYGLKMVDDGRGAYHFENDPDAAAQDLPLPPTDTSEESDPHWNK